MTILAHNRSATFHYEIQERFEAGLALMGSEVKSLRLNRSSLQEAYIVHRAGELFVHNWSIAPYAASPLAFNHALRRERKLLLHRRQINQIAGGITRKGLTAIPLKVYTTARGWVKIEIALAAGKKKEDKRHSIKEREWKRQKQRVLKTTSQD